jgi:hypothetical protein
MRTILFVLALLGAVTGRAQIFLDWYGAAAPAAGLLLDDYPNAAAAYSLRLLNSAYTGNCIEVRRSNDNALQNIGFEGGVLDTAALKTFCGANNCFVRTWYDQANNGWNLQATTTKQPLIVSAGIVNRTNGQPAILFDGSDDGLDILNLPTYTGVTTTFCVFNQLTGGGSFPYVWDHGNQRYILYIVNNTIIAYVSADLNTLTRVFGQQYLAYVFYNTSASQVIINTNSYTGNTGAFNTHNAINLASDGGTPITFTRGNIQEFITYRSNQSSNQSGIRGNINTFYSIY